MAFFGWFFIFEYFSNLAGKDLLRQAKLVHHLVEYLL
jgi:hypothetical protein